MDFLMVLSGRAGIGTRVDEATMPPGRRWCVVWDNASAGRLGNEEGVEMGRAGLQDVVVKSEW